MVIRVFDPKVEGSFVGVYVTSDFAQVVHNNCEVNQFFFGKHTDQTLDSIYMDLLRHFGLYRLIPTPPEGMRVRVVVEPVQ